jgi:hypothetical protein
VQTWFGSPHCESLVQPARHLVPPHESGRQISTAALPSGVQSLSTMQGFSPRHGAGPPWITVSGPGSGGKHGYCPHSACDRQPPAPLDIESDGIESDGIESDGDASAGPPVDCVEQRASARTIVMHMSARGANRGVRMRRVYATAVPSGDRREPR